MAGHSFGGCLGVSLLDKFTENELNIYWGSRWLPLQTIGSISVKWSCLILRCNVSLSPRSQRAWIKWGGSSGRDSSLERKDSSSDSILGDQL